MKIKRFFINLKKAVLIRKYTRLGGKCVRNMAEQMNAKNGIEFKYWEYQLTKVTEKLHRAYML